MLLSYHTTPPEELVALKTTPKVHCRSNIPLKELDWRKRSLSKKDL